MFLNHNFSWFQILFFVSCFNKSAKVAKLPHLLTMPIRNAFRLTRLPCFTFAHLSNLNQVITWPDYITPALCDNLHTFGRLLREFSWHNCDVICQRWTSLSEVLTLRCEVKGLPTFWQDIWLLTWTYERRTSESSDLIRGPPESPWHVSPPPSISSWGFWLSSD